MSNILVICAHPDDESLGLGGTLALHASQGDTVNVLMFATGQYGRDESKKGVSERQKQGEKAFKILGVKNVDFYDFPDNEMDKISNLEITKSIEKIIKSFKPEIVLTHSNSDLNIDHRIIYNATLTATRPMNTSSVQEVISFEIPSSTEWNFTSPFSPNMFVDISKELKFKLKALSQYKSELKQFPHPRSLKGIEIIAKRWGTVCGYPAAEAFQIIRQIRKNF